MRGALVAALAIFACAGCAHRPLPPQPVVLGPDAATQISLPRFLTDNPLPPGKDLAATKVGESAFSSLHIVQIRTREKPHIHAEHDLTAYVLKGHGSLVMITRVGSSGYSCSMREIRKGDAATIPQGTIHWFTNKSDEPSVALASFSPPFDGKDVVPQTDTPIVKAIDGLTTVPGLSFTGGVWIPDSALSLGRTGTGSPQR